MAETNYIPLSRNLLADPKVKALQFRYGAAAGVGHWAIMLLELYAARMPISIDNKFMREAIRGDHGMTEEELSELCDLCAEVGLIDPMLWKESRQICNPHVLEHSQWMQAQQDQRVEAGRKSGEARRKKGANK